MEILVREPDFPDSPGLLFQLSLADQSYSLRPCAVVGLKRARDAFTRDPSRFPMLWDDPLYPLWAFPTQNIAHAKDLQQTYTKRRFPLHMYQALNLSDRGICWSLDVKSNEIHLHSSFRENCQELAPMGDSATLIKVLPVFLNDLGKAIPGVHKWVINDIENVEATANVLLGRNVPWITTKFSEHTSQIYDLWCAHLSFWSELKLNVLKHSDSQHHQHIESL